MSPKKPKPLTLEDLMEKGLVHKGSDERFIIHRIPFGLPELDEIVSGGLPRDRITILTGEYSSGKSFLIQLIMKNALEKDLQVAYIDTERTYDPAWWSQIGLDIDKVLVSQPPSGEDAVNVAETLAREGFDIVAMDSLAGLVPMAELEEGAEKQFIAGQAKLVQRLLHKILAIHKGTAVICTNQLRSSIGPGPIDHMPGGWAQKYFGHLLLRIFRESWIEEKGGVRVGFNMKVVCRKSKVGRGYRECLLPFRFRGEIDVLAMLVDRALEANIIEQKGPYYKILDGESIMGKNRVLELLGGDDALVHRLETALGDEQRSSSEDSS